MGAEYFMQTGKPHELSAQEWGRYEWNIEIPFMFFPFLKTHSLKSLCSFSDLPVTILLDGLSLLSFGIG
jgi:hypothetical protein